MIKKDSLKNYELVKNIYETQGKIEGRKFS